ncbi:MAG: hypothetical protein Nkreftii_004167 [Candidatus Nitrospira kreftii]|uniref:Uncharacterized protein n=1 Tax=Candidatus Nitrospira kreftii TaxID=2652173 RepID=A0A7S8J249_9BACT|nr:MAG: hypothetical protein Nkreftii_004167 [Candidatus Nitrospira kreftii]
MNGYGVGFPKQAPRPPTKTPGPKQRNGIIVGVPSRLEMQALTLSVAMSTRRITYFSVSLFRLSTT